MKITSYQARAIKCSIIFLLSLALCSVLPNSSAYAKEKKKPLQISVETEALIVSVILPINWPVMEPLIGRYDPGTPLFVYSHELPFTFIGTITWQNILLGMKIAILSGSYSYGGPMVHIDLVANDEVRAQMPRFEKILTAYDLSIVKQKENHAAGTIEIVVNAHSLAYCRTVNTAAYDCLGEALGGFKVIP
jgi:hypothetical protein